MKSEVAIVCLTAIAIVSMLKDGDMNIVYAAITAVAGLGGFTFGYRVGRKVK